MGQALFLPPRREPAGHGAPLNTTRRNVHRTAVVSVKSGSVFFKTSLNPSIGLIRKTSCRTRKQETLKNLCQTPGKVKRGDEASHQSPSQSKEGVKQSNTVFVFHNPFLRCQGQSEAHPSLLLSNTECECEALGTIWPRKPVGVEETEEGGLVGVLACERVQT